MILGLRHLPWLTACLVLASADDHYDETDWGTACSSPTIQQSPIQLQTPILGELQKEDLFSIFSCVDTQGWESSAATPETCTDYKNKKYCENGTYGSGWERTKGDFKAEADTNGQGASEACCVCGGGSRSLTGDFTIEEDTNIKLTPNGATDIKFKEATFSHIELHLPPQHHIDSQYYDAEIEFYFSNPGGSMDYAISVFVDGDGDSDKGHMIELKHFFDPHSKFDATRAGFDLYRLFPANGRRYFEYQGTQVSTPCSSVTRYIMDVPIWIAQIKDESSGTGDQSRALQELRAGTKLTRGGNASDWCEKDDGNCDFDGIPLEFVYPCRVENWVHFSRTCKFGEKQSPIDFLPTTLTQSQGYQDILHRSNLEIGVVDGPEIDTFGHLTYVVDGRWTGFHPHDGMTEMVLEDIKIKLNAEHTVNGEQEDLELQFNFKPSKVNVSPQKKINDLTVSVIFQLGETDNDIIDDVFLQDRYHESKSHFSDLFPSFFTRRFYMYEGSITVPPCTENVTWIVFEEFQNISRKQHLALLSLTKTHYSTTRHVQNLLGRKISVGQDVLLNYDGYRPPYVEQRRNEDAGGNDQEGDDDGVCYSPSAFWTPTVLAILFSVGITASFVI